MLFYSNYSLQSCNTFNINAKADFFFEINNISELQSYIRKKKYSEMPKIILGNGSNILFTTDYKGVVLKNKIKGVDIVSQDNQHIIIKVASGENFDDFVAYCCKNRYCGIENLSGIPGSIGGAVVQNIGAYGKELSEIVQEVEYYDFETNQIKNILAKDCNFAYRNSIFKTELKDKIFILSATFLLNKAFQPCLTYGNLSSILEEHPILTPAIMRRSILAIRNQKIPDTKQFGNAGSFFKNPEVDAQMLEKIKSIFPELKFFDLGNGKYKLLAAQLIEKCGFKGQSEGNVGVWQNQPLILVNISNASGKEILKYSQKIAKTVKEKFLVTLQPEVCVI